MILRSCMNFHMTLNIRNSDKLFHSYIALMILLSSVSFYLTLNREQIPCLLMGSVDDFFSVYCWKRRVVAMVGIGLCLPYCTLWDGIQCCICLRRLQKIIDLIHQRSFSVSRRHPFHKVRFQCRAG